MKNYNGMSDYQINIMVLRLINDGCAITFDHDNKKVYRYDGVEFDPCNNQLDALPLMIKYGIGIDCLGDSWFAGIWLNGKICYDQKDKNPLRAAMICYLKMRGSQCK